MRETPLLVVGGGPAGLCAALEAAGLGVDVTLVDSDLHLGGQLVKQTHKFFGSKHEYAGTRGYKIADVLLAELKQCQERISVHSNTTALSYYAEDGSLALVRGEQDYCKIRPQRLIMATGANEKLIPFLNNHLPGVYGAGAVQTLMNSYGVKPGNRVLMVGAGNIGLIVSYQLLQAGVNVVGIVEAQDRVGGYWVHAAKVRRLGVPIYLRHTVTEALGEREVNGALLQEIDQDFRPINEPQRIDCDVICLAVGLSPNVELLWQAGCDMTYIPQLCGYVAKRDKSMRTSCPHIWVAGDCAGIEEASSAMVEGRLAGLAAAQSLGRISAEEYAQRYDHYWNRLTDLRAGEVGEKICMGIMQAMVHRWENVVQEA